MAARFRQLSATAVPLAEQGAFVDAARATLGEWCAALDREYRAAR